jgi:NADPH:quinone reductase
MTAVPTTGIQLRSLVTSDGVSADGTLQLSLESVEVPKPGPDHVVVSIGASPINPSDLGLLLAAADLATAMATGTPERPVVTATIPPEVMKGLTARVGESMAVGNEGGGTVIAAGSSPEAQALMGATVGVLGGSMYSQYRVLHVSQCLALPSGTTPQQAASCFVNPLTALAMVETMRREGHTALVHTAAASNLGQMLVKICLSDGVELVNIVRKPAQAELLRSIGAKHVCDSSSPTFLADLTSALITTGATLAFDATGGGALAGQILGCMESAANATAKEYSRYGSMTHKQVYIYGGLERSVTTLNRNFGMAWGVGGWLLTPFLMKVGPDIGAAMRARVASEITTTFASHYSAEISLTQALSLDTLRAYAKQATGEKYLINPTL